MPRNGKGAGNGKAAGQQSHGQGAGPSWKPDKATIEGSYGEAVSDAARAKPKPAMPEGGQSPSKPRRGKPQG